MTTSEKWKKKMRERFPLFRHLRIQLFRLIDQEMSTNKETNNEAENKLWSISNPFHIIKRFWKIILGKSARLRLYLWACPFLCLCVCARACVHLCVYVCLCYNSSHRSYLNKSKNVKNYVCRFWQLPMNCVIVKIVRRDFDLLFQVKKKSEMVRTSAKMRGRHL